MFYIGFVTAARVDADGWRYAEGELTLGAYSERFQSDLGTWSMPEYEAQWRTAAARLLAGGRSTAFLTSYRGPGAAYHFIWPAWREGSLVHFQERVVLVDQLPGPFVPDEVFALVGERVTVNEDGDKVSEWPVPLGQIATFVADG